MTYCDCRPHRALLFARVTRHWLVRTCTFCMHYSLCTQPVATDNSRTSSRDKEQNKAREGPVSTCGAFVQMIDKSRWAQSGYDV